MTGPSVGSTGGTGGAVPAAARVAGTLLAAVVAAVRHVRSRPLHPRGTLLRGTLRIDPVGAPGVRELGPPRRLPVLVRVSRSAGLPTPLPDVLGLALRWTEDGRDHDVLLSSTGLGRATRFLLALRVRPGAGPFGTLMPYRDAHGRPVLLAVVPVGRAGRRPDGTGTDALAGTELLVLSARPSGRWHRIGLLTCADVVHEPAPRFDPVLHAPAGLGTYRWAAALRVPSYAAARGARPAPVAAPGVLT